MAAPSPIPTTFATVSDLLDPTLFGTASKRSFRRVAYAIIAASALISLSVFDRFLR